MFNRPNPESPAESIEALPGHDQNFESARQAPERTHETTARQVRAFIATEIIPREPLLGQDDPSAARLISHLAEKARAASLWGLYFPPSLGGRFHTLEDYLPAAEEEGRSEHGPAVFGSESAVDIHMLHRYGNDDTRSRFLMPTVAGEAIPSYGMSEPDGVGSSPATIAMTAEARGGSLILNGRKWFVCRADRAAFVTVVARSSPDAPLDHALSMIIVPMDSDGVRIERRLPILGRFQGQCEISFSNVTVPESFALGERGRGLALMHQRLGLGRILRASQWIGLAQRCLDLMCARVHSRRGELARLADKQLIRLHVFEAHKAVASARALVRLAACGLDAKAPSDIDIVTAKIAASEALTKASDSAVQIFGAEGVSDQTPLSDIFRIARATRFMDGTDEALISAAGRRILDFYAGREA
jgi:acyl-CoA dehydrogenase